MKTMIKLNNNLYIIHHNQIKINSLQILCLVNSCLSIQYSSSTAPATASSKILMFLPIVVEYEKIVVH